MMVVLTAREVSPFEESNGLLNTLSKTYVYSLTLRTFSYDRTVDRNLVHCFLGRILFIYYDKMTSLGNHWCVR